MSSDFPNSDFPNNDFPGGDASTGQAGDASASTTAPPPPAQYPVPTPARRSPGRQVLIVFAVAVSAVIGMLMLFAALLFALAAGAAIGFASDVDVEKIAHSPATVAEIPESITADEAEIVVDLSDLTAEDFENLDQPVEMEIDVNFGSVQIIVPEGVATMVDADTDFGSTEVFDRFDDGFDTSVTHVNDAADLQINADVDFGEIRVERS